MANYLVFLFDGNPRSDPVGLCLSFARPATRMATAGLSQPLRLCGCGRIAPRVTKTLKNRFETLLSPKQFIHLPWDGLIIP